MKYTLGIDMGVASIGWAVISKDDTFIDCGVRVFPAGVDNFNSSKEKHPNQDRRAARGMRRRIRRKAMRKYLLQECMQQAGMMPTDKEEVNKWYRQDVYHLRHRAIDERISLHELGRVLYHLNQRRGFLSLRKKEESKPGDNEVKGMLGAISALQDDINKSGHRTLGNFLYHLYDKNGEGIRLRNRHTRRSMIYDEFCIIWDKQSEYYPGVLTAKLRYGELGPRPNPIAVSKPIRRSKTLSFLNQFGLENISFFQRAVYWNASSIGFCELEPDENRAPIADRRFQRFRMLQEINNLRILDPSQSVVKERDLSRAEREYIIDYVSTKKEAAFVDIKKHLAKKLRDNDTLRFQFNMEKGGRAKLSAMPTDYALAAKKAYGKNWWKLDDALRNRIVEILCDPQATDDDIATSLSELKGIETERIDALLHVHLPAGYANLSTKAIEKLLPHIELGLLYHTHDPALSSLHAAGYKRRDEEINKVYDLLPAYEHNDIAHLPVINSPIVRRSLTELRKVVNAIIRKNGKPNRIHLEMARELKMGPKQRSEYNKENSTREKARNAARNEIKKLGVVPNRAAENLYLLWQEQKERCAYSCEVIGIHQLLGGEVEIDHIYPYSRSADDSVMNKVVCFRDENRSKGDQTPFEWLNKSNPDKYDKIIKQSQFLPYAKQQRIISDSIPEGFINRDLNDTAWMASAARLYLACLFDSPSKVLGTKGAHTAKLREHWQLHSLLRNDGIDLKNRDDHRHHALDAAVIALCDQATIHALSTRHRFELDLERLENGKYRFFYHNADNNPLEAPWDDFRSDLAKALDSFWVSHRPRRKISGSFHKETHYGKTRDGQLVVRKPLQSLTEKERTQIRDPEIQRIVSEHIKRGGTLGDSIVLPSGTPIRKIRILINSVSVPIRGGTTHVQSAATHHLAIFKHVDGTYHFEPVTLMEAAARIRRKEPVIQKRYTGMPEDSEFVMHLCSGDSMMAEINGIECLYIFNTMATTTRQVWFAHHCDATQGHEDPVSKKSLLKSCTPGSFAKNFPNARKVLVLPSGEIRNGG